MEDTVSLPVTFQDINRATENIKTSKHVTRTPLLRADPSRFGIEEEIELYFKMETMQTGGSFKIRGIVNQMENAPKEVKDGDRTLITMSAGNYGRSFAYMCKELNLKGHVLMPITAPQNRVDLIRNYGLHVQQMPSKELKSSVERYVSEQGMLYLHPFDDVNLIAGYGSIGLEILEDLKTVDIILVCCGGGGLLSGIASAIRYSDKGKGTRIIGVEPEGACTMYLSLKKEQPITKGDAKSIAGGLAPPFAGTNTYNIVSQFVDDVILVSDKEIIECVRIMYNNGLVVEPSGVAAFCALKSGKIGDIAGKRVVVTLSGGNVSPQELVELMKV